jgi:hypothetical protein
LGCQAIARVIYNDLVTSLALTIAAVLAAATSVPSKPAAPAPAAPPVFAVVPGGSGSPLGAAPTHGRPRLVWTGFQMVEGGSRVFVQTTAEVELKVGPGKGGVTLTLHNCRVHLRNNSRTLDTRYFASPVQQIAVHQRRRDIELDVALRAAVQSIARREEGPGGTHFWVIDFTPAGEEAAAPVPARTGSVSLK